MRCAKCGKETLDDAPYCAWCRHRHRPADAPRHPWGSWLITGMIVLAGLGLLLFPVIYSSRLFGHHHDGKQSKTLNNIRQLAMAVQQYSYDYNETFPGWLVRSDGRPVHNCWDEQIDPFVKAKDVYYDSGPGIRSSSDPHRQRVLSYGLNALLIAENDGTGNADWSKGPNPLSPSTLNNPANTILFAELDAEQSPAAIALRYGDVDAVSRINPDSSDSPQLDEKQRSRIGIAHTGWIDIDPRAWVEQGRGAAAYNEDTWGDAAKRGVARDLHGGGGVYAFCDGHVAFMRLSRTTTGGQDILPDANWDQKNTQTLPYNMWWPQ